MKLIPSILSRAGLAASEPKPGRGFTLIELLVAVGALAFVGVGIAAIFGATGRTLEAGKRVSAFQSYAAQIEQQMRADFRSITRDGFLVIRNEYAGGRPASGTTPDAVPLTADDFNPRPRRIDQIMFFSKGQFTSAREPLVPGQVAKSEYARIYYGHGQRALKPADPVPASSEYLRPSLSGPTGTPLPGTNANLPDIRLGAVPAAAGVENPNRFASSWTLLRHVTLLAKPETAASDLPAPLPLSLSSQQWEDNRSQISLQPAAISIFRGLQQVLPTEAGSATLYRGLDQQRPVFATGIVDIAITDPSMMRSVVVTADRWPDARSLSIAGTQSPGTPLAADQTFFDAPTYAGGPPPGELKADGLNWGPDGKFRLLTNPPTASAGEDRNVILRMQAWLDDAWPTDVLPSEANATQRDRIRTEPVPVNLLGASLAGGTPLEQNYRRADQLMLSASNFLPRCTEFIVEWSLGQTYPSDTNDPDYVVGKDGQLIWHGMDRFYDPYTGAADQPRAARPYDDTGASRDSRLGRASVPWRRVDGSIARTDPYTAPAATPLATLAHRVRSALIHGKAFENGPRPDNQRAEALTSYFGYIDPTFDPDRDAPAGVAVPDGRLSSAGDAASPTIPWIWPRFIRVTLSLADPNDAKFEQTFQFVFEVPPSRE